MKELINYHIFHFSKFIYIFYNNYFYYLLWKLSIKLIKKIYGKKNFNIMYNHIGSPGFMLWLIFVLLVRNN